MLVQNKSANKKGGSPASTTTSCIVYQLLNKNFASNISQVPKKEVSLKYISANRVEPAFQPVKYARNTNTNTKTNTFVYKYKHKNKYICLYLYFCARRVEPCIPSGEVCAQDPSMRPRCRKSGALSFPALTTLKLQNGHLRPAILGWVGLLLFSSPLIV